MTTQKDYPRIIAHLGVTDHGPSDDGRGSTTCPHCGADGRYVHHFLLENGTKGAAMSGCIKLFPMSELAIEQKRINEKESSRRKLNSWDEKALDAIEAVIAGSMDEDTAVRIVRQQKAACAAWVSRKFRR
jgi:hypothetical protein